MTWKQTQLKHVADITLGKMLQSSPKSDSDELRPYARAASIGQDGELRTGQSKSMWFSPNEARDLDLRRHDVLVVEGGDAGRCLILHQDQPGWGLQNSVNRVRARPGADPRFLYYSLVAARNSGKLRAYCDVVSIPHLTAEKLKRVPIQVPPSDEQQAIADFLDRETAKIDTLIAKQEQLIAAFRERRISLVATVTVARLRPGVPLRETRHSWLGAVPAHWEVKPLWSMFTRVKDTDHPEEQMLSVFREHGVVVKEDHENINRTAENRSIYQLIHPGWLATNRMKAWQGSVGISPHRGIISGHYICFAPTHQENSTYLNWLFRSTIYAAGYSQISRGVRIGQAEIDNDAYRLLPVLVPPAEEQYEIAEYLTSRTNAINTLIAKAEQFIALAEERRSALITTAVSGRTRTHVVDAASGRRQGVTKVM